MGRIFNIIIFLLLLSLVVIANGSFFGYSFKEEPVKESTFDLAEKHKVVYTMPSAKDIKGYGGAIPIAIAINDEDTILDIKILKNAEDPNYLGEVIEAKFLDNWIGLPIEKAANLNVDAVSGATLSSTAIAKSMKLKAQELSGLQSQKEDINYINILKVLALLFVMFSGFLSFYYPAKFSKYRTLLLASNVFILGIWQGAMLSIFNISNWLINGIPNIFSYCMLAIFLLSIILPFFTNKNYYCMYLCPFGASQELVSKAIKIKKYSINKFFFKGLERAKIAILIFCFMLLILGLGENIVNIEPFSAFKPAMASKVAIAIFVLSLILSMFTPRVWCRYFCPCGAFLDLFKRKVTSKK